MEFCLKAEYLYFCVYFLIYYRLRIRRRFFTIIYLLGSILHNILSTLHFSFHPINHYDINISYIKAPLFALCNSNDIALFNRQGFLPGIYSH